MRCSTCKQDKPATEFYRNNTRPRGYQSVCKDCDLARARHPAVIAQRKAYREVHGRRFRLKRLYGVTEEWYADRLTNQGDRCAICGTPDRPRFERWFIDHDHVTGSPRSLLCSACNGGLGYFLDSPQLLEIASAYVRSHKQSRASGE